jgi:hypothetical protein
MIVSIPISMRRTGGRRQVVIHTFVKALARTHRWRAACWTNLFTTVRDLFKAEKINEAYLCHVLCLTLLLPNITEATLTGRLPVGVGLVFPR